MSWNIARKTSDLTPDPAVYASPRQKGQTLLEADDAIQELIAICTDDSKDAQLRELLSQPRWEAIATARPHWIDRQDGPGEVWARPILNLEVLVERAADALQPACLKTLLSFGAAHDLSGDTLIDRYTFSSSLQSTATAAVLADFAPSLVKCHLGHSGHILEYAVKYCSTEIVTLLLDRGAQPSDVPTKNDLGRPVAPLLWYAAVDGDYEKTKLLLDRGLPIEKSAALHAAADEGSIKVMNLLVDHGANVNERLDHIYVFTIPEDLGSSWTPMHAAAAAGKADAVAWLKSHGADPNIRDKQNHTPDDILASNSSAAAKA